MEFFFLLIEGNVGFKELRIGLSHLSGERAAVSYCLFKSTAIFSKQVPPPPRFHHTQPQHWGFQHMKIWRTVTCKTTAAKFIFGNMSTRNVLPFFWGRGDRVSPQSPGCTDSLYRPSYVQTQRSIFLPPEGASLFTFSSLPFPVSFLNFRHGYGNFGILP